MDGLGASGTKTAWWLGVLALLVGGTLALALTRVYQVDEAQTVYMAAVHARGWTGTAYSSGQLHLYPLSLLVRQGASSAQIFTTFRIFFWALFWVNAVLVVLAGGLRLRSAAGLRALILVGTLAPWWAYALECRHDNILMTGMLCLWLLARRVRTVRRELVFLGLGFLSLILHACLFKSVATWLPLAALLLFLEPAGWRARAGKAGGFLLGAALGLGFAWAVRAHGGILGNVVEGRGALQVTLAVERLSPFPALVRLLHTAPLLLAGMAGLLLNGAVLIRRHGLSGAWREVDGFPETLLFAVCALAYFINPNPFPYNLAVLSGGAMVALLALGRPWLEPGAFKGARALPFLLALGLVLHLAPWLIRLAALAGMDNDRQVDLMILAEEATGPGDTVFDGIGMVPTRRAPGFAWLLNMTNFKSFEGHPMTAAWKDAPPAVILPSYRINYLQKEDLAFISDHYVSLHRDFWVLGAKPLKTADTVPWTCLKAGRYAVVPLKGAPAQVTLDGRSLASGFQWLGQGPHTLAMDPAAPCLVVWAGPKATSLPHPDEEGLESLCPLPGMF